MNQDGPAIRTEGLTKVFLNGARAVSGLDLEVGRGQVFGFLGPNGAGKTTTVRLLNGTLAPTGGSARVLGRAPGEEEVRRLTATVTEEAQMYDHLSLEENLAFFAAMFDLPDPEARARSTELLGRLGLESLSRRRLGSLSTGQKKRAQLARALLHRPSILFLDEPTSGLDAEAALAVTALIRRLASEQGVTVFLCTHNLFLAERVCDGFGFMRSGQLAASGRKEDIIRARTAQPRVRITTLSGVQTLPYERAEQIDGLVRGVQAAGEKVVEVQPVTATLEEAYFHYVGRQELELA